MWSLLPLEADGTMTEAQRKEMDRANTAVGICLDVVQYRRKELRQVIEDFKDAQIILNELLTRDLGLDSANDLHNLLIWEPEIDPNDLPK